MLADILLANILLSTLDDLRAGLVFSSRQLLWQSPCFLARATEQLLNCHLMSKIIPFQRNSLGYYAQVQSPLCIIHWPVQSKTDKIVPIGYPRWPPSWKSILHFFPEPKGQMTRNLVGSIETTCRSKKVTKSFRSKTQEAAIFKIYFALLHLNRTVTWLETL